MTEAGRGRKDRSGGDGAVPEIRDVAFTRACMGCGVDAGTATPFREERYGLIVVACPGCGAVMPAMAAGGPSGHALVRWWRGLMRGARALAALGLLIGAGALSALFMVVTTVWFGDDLRGSGLALTQVLDAEPSMAARWAMWRRGEGWMSAIGAACGAGVMGAWIGLALGHNSSRRFWLVGAGIVAGAHLLPWVVWAAEAWTPRVVGEPARALSLTQGVVALTTAVVGLPMVVVGIGVGLGAGLTMRRMRSRRWRRRLRRARARRHTT